LPSRFFGFLKYTAGLSIAALVSWTVVTELKDYTLGEIVSALVSIPTRKILLAMAFTILDYTIIAAVDFLGLRWLGCKTPFAKTAFAAVTGNALWCNAGVIAGSSAKFRLYDALGLAAVQTGSLITFTSITYFLGLCFLGGTLGLLRPFPVIGQTLPLPADSSKIIPLLLLSVPVAYLFFSAARKKSLSVAGHEMTLPDIKTAMAQILLASTDWIIAGTILIVLLPDMTKFSAISVISAYILAQTGVLVSQVPGGIGILEGMLLILLPPSITGDYEIASILVFRIIFSLFPLLLSSFSYGIFELWNKNTSKNGEKGYNTD